MRKQNEKLIGGEGSLKNEKGYCYLTDSGRSSLSLILHSELRKKRFLLPDYLCYVVKRIFDENEIQYDFYRVESDLTINLKGIENKKFDVFYVINYFGQRHKNIGDIYKKHNTLVIEDNVFLPVFEKPRNIEHWIGFNSFRKISNVPEGSIVKSTIPLREELIQPNPDSFSRLKYKAKGIKHEYLYENKHSQNKYLRLFQKAERILDQQQTICSISDKSLCNLFAFYQGLDKEYAARRKNYQTLQRYLSEMSPNILPEYPSFYVLLIKERDKLRKFLFSKRVFLPVHWPVVTGISNILYQQELSIPIDSRYDTGDMKKISGWIKDF